jgi:RND superfamily putative drug exporter
MRRHPWIVILIWFIAGMGLASLAGLKGVDVTNDDTAAFLPKSSESARATEFGRRAFGQVEGATTVTILVKPRDGGRIDAADHRAAAGVAAELRDWHGERARVVGAKAGAGAPAFDLIGVEFKGKVSDPVVQESFKRFRAHATDALAQHDLRAGFTGGIASVVDVQETTASTQSLEKLILFGSIVLLNVLFFRGVLAAIVPLLTVFIVSGAASGVVVGGAWLLGFELDVGTQQLVTTVLMGIGIDYLLFLVFRFREQLRAGYDRRAAADRAARRVSHVIASAALAVAVAFGTLGLAEFGQFRVLGPAIAVSVLVMLLAGVTLMPAVLAVTGRAFFWPSKSWRRERSDGVAARIGRLVVRRPRTVLAASFVALAALAAGAFGTNLSYDLTLKDQDMKAVRVADEIAAALPRGATDPQTVYVRSGHVLHRSELQPLVRRLSDVRGVEQVGTPQLTRDGRGAAIGVVLDASSTSERALNIARGPLRDAAHSAAPAGSEAMVGGTAAVFADVSDSIARDLKLIFPVAAALIALILVAMLRSAVAPAYLLAAVGLEFAATLGASTLLFQGVVGEPGVAFNLRLVLFLFVVALGTDYNMLVSARLREEMRAGRSVADAVAQAVRHTAPAIAAASFVLATAFGSLALYPDVGTRETGFAMAVGILIAALVVSTFMVPAITALVGDRAWWPGRRAARPADAHAERPLAA